MERTTRLELATSPLARGRSTRWATVAYLASVLLGAWIIIRQPFQFVNTFFQIFLNGFEHPPNRVSHFELDML